MGTGDRAVTSKASHDPAHFASRELSPLGLPHPSTDTVPSLWTQALRWKGSQCPLPQLSSPKAADVFLSSPTILPCGGKGEHCRPISSEQLEVETPKCTHLSPNRAARQLLPPGHSSGKWPAVTLAGLGWQPRQGHREARPAEVTSWLWSPPVPDP